MDQNRKVIDCRTMPSESGCTLTISGTADEVLRVAREHAISSHGHKGGPELDEMLRAGMRDEVPSQV
jgi:Protein of unknown function (DUF1059)